MIHAYWGNGKGKTSAAFGLALRAAMRGWRVEVVQFLKGTTRYGEVRAAPPFSINIHQFGRECLHPERPNCRGCTDCHIDPQNPKEEDYRNAAAALKKASLLASNAQLLILDEVLYALAFGLINENDLLRLLQQAKCEVVLTGNPLTDPVRKLCHYVSRFVSIKHHIEQGHVSVVGIDQ